MPCKVTWKDKELLWELSGNISAAEFHKINNDHQGDPRWDNLRFLIADFREVISIDLPEEDVLMIQAMDKVAAQSNPFLKIASIANSNETRKFAEFYSTDTPWKFGIFETIEEARSWFEK